MLKRNDKHLDDFQDHLRAATFACRDMAIELEDMLLRFRRHVPKELASSQPHELIDVWTAMCKLRASLLHSEQLAREEMPS